MYFQTDIKNKLLFFNALAGVHMKPPPIYGSIHERNMRFGMGRRRSLPKMETCNSVTACSVHRFQPSTQAAAEARQWSQER